ncbi:MAG: response regulator transcription factor [Clostridiaceae bacterium]|jgi:DNA-binding response OmpR family regulator|nr:response regulator transcription factor [Bacillota bacterium]NLN52196.1 response regulator transcription factor [Clostridiaceae bacterium]
MKKILIIEDDTNINHLIKEALDQAGFVCSQAFSGTEGLLLAEAEDYSVILLDLMLPGLSGEDLLPKLKAVRDTPIMVLSAKDTLDSKLDLLTNGADDYMTKPFSLEELMARVNILSKRFQTEKPHKLLKYKDLILDQENYTAEVKGHDLNLTVSELKILSLLMQYPDRVFTKQDIYEYAWDEHYVGSDKTINVHISNIRKKLNAFTDVEYIETVWGIGFKFKH